MIRVDGFDGRLDLAFEPGEVVLLKGPNGSGKTSILRLLAGLSSPMPAARVVTTRASWSPQSARDALIGLTVRGEWRLRGREHDGPLAHRDVATLSSGEARRVALELASLSAPLLLLDEPAEGLDTEGREQLVKLVRSRKESVVVAADHAGILDDVATRVIHLAPTQAGGLPEKLNNFHVLVGPNGSGKTTRLRELAKTTPGARFAQAHPWFTRDSVREELVRAEAWVVEALVPATLLERHPLTLSGGEAQRASLARALGVASHAYFLDEPEAHLDAQGRRALFDVLARRAREGSHILAATHEDAIANLAQTRTVLS